MNSKERVRRAVEFTGPDKMPIYYFNKYTERSDILMPCYGSAGDFVPKSAGDTEWGFEWERMDDTMGQPKAWPITDWSKLDGFAAPNPDLPERFTHIRQTVNDHPDKYIIAGMGITGFNLVTFLRGFENTLYDFYLDTDNINKLCDIAFEFEERMIQNFAACGVDAVAFYDDWGTQKSLMVSPAFWRKHFKWRYKRQFELAHAHGLHVFFHCCGQIYDIIPDLIEIGADILNLNQPDLFGIERLGRDFGGKVCFNCPVDHQTVAIKGTRAEIFDYARRLKEHLGRFNGGFIANIEEYHSVGMSDENFEAICEAFESIR